ncbi:hypothetical protein N9Y05_00055 [Candidatus Pelagibacter bacterium]|nr:hypothetical protein [Candidatus Pelagibacter bacterium]MDB2696318.1 hypothetical protein [Candidatus Pelagibacter bacterium]
MNMIKNLISKIFIIIFCLIFTNNLFAATNVKGAATEYIITMTKIELCETGSTISNCLNPINITTGNGASADIAGVEAGQAAATVADFGKATLGKTYTYIQTTMSRAMTITGRAGTNGKCTTKAGVNGALDSAGAKGALNGTPGSAILYVPFFSQDLTYFSMMEGSDENGENLATLATVRSTDTHFRSRQVLTTPYTPVAGSSPTVFLAFDTSIAVNELNDALCTDAGLQAAPPKVTITIQGQ